MENIMEDIEKNKIFIATGFAGFSKKGDLLFRAAQRSMYDMYTRKTRAIVLIRTECLPKEVIERIKERPHYLLQRLKVVAQAIVVNKQKRIIIAEPVWLGETRKETGWGFFDATGLWWDYSETGVNIIEWEWGDRNAWKKAGEWAAYSVMGNEIAIPITEEELRKAGYYKQSEVSTETKRKIYLSRPPI